MRNSTYQNSRFLHLFDRNGQDRVFCIFHSLTQRKLYGGKILRDIYKSFASPSEIGAVKEELSAAYPVAILERIISDLTTHDMITPDTQADLNTYLNFFHTGANLYEIRHTYFIPVSDCNLRCRYCFVEDENKDLLPTGKMTSDTAKKALEVFAKLTAGQREKISLTFYGGEPLLNKPVLCNSMRYVRELERDGRFEKPVEMSLLTNGVLMDDAVVSCIVETGTMVSVSIDGPKALHDAARKDIAQTGSFEHAVKGFAMLREAGVKPGVSCTLNQYNIHAIEQVVDFIIEELQPPGMGFNILLPTMGSGNPLDVEPEYAAAQLIRAFKRLREKGIYEDRVMRRVLPFTEPFFHFKDCMGVGGQIVIAPDGSIGPCQAFLGNADYFPINVDELHSNFAGIDSDTIYQYPLFEEWRYRFPLNMVKCADCVAISICGGGCPYASMVNHGSIWEIDERICHQAKAIQEWMIWDAYENMPGEEKAA
ncbi:MAG: radical SAM protein [Desulfohalobiaceae bacterium]|nr:radical SAM protein [Desulfohalobiaceae bacterium]